MNEDLFLKQIKLGPMENFVYLIGSKSTREVSVVDPAWDIQFLLDHIEQKGMVLSSILVTHYHPDHIDRKAVPRGTLARLPPVHHLGPYQLNSNQSQEGYNSYAGKTEYPGAIAHRYLSRAI